MIQVQFIKSQNGILGEVIVTPRIVNMQNMDFQDWCDYLADGSTVTAADVSAVMKQLEKKLPAILGFNTKVNCSPDGLSFRPKVSGFISQSDLKEKLTAKKEAETDPKKAALIDVNRPLSTSDLSINDCSVSIVVDLPKSWNAIFMQKAKLKRVTKATTVVDESGQIENSGQESTAGNSGNTNTGGVTTGGENEPIDGSNGD